MSATVEADKVCLQGDIGGPAHLIYTLQWTTYELLTLRSNCPLTQIGPVARDCNFSGLVFIDPSCPAVNVEQAFFSFI